MSQRSASLSRSASRLPRSTALVKAESKVSAISVMGPEYSQKGRNVGPKARKAPDRVQMPPLSFARERIGIPKYPAVSSASHGQQRCDLSHAHAPNPTVSL